MRVAVLVEEVGHAELAQVQGEVALGARAGQLVQVVFVHFGIGAEGEDLAQVQPRQVQVGRGVADAERFAVWEARHAAGPAQAAAAGHLGVEVQGRPLPQPPPDERAWW